MLFEMKHSVRDLIVRVLFNFCFLNNLLSFGFVSGKTISTYDGFCKDELLYKPYIKYYRGRMEAVKTGIPFKIHPPGFWTDFLDDDMENTYVCVNGMAWLYYRLTTGTTVVYEAPELHAYVHNCMLVNGVKGPGMHNVERLLLGILLMGEPHDYRLPSIQLFTAPYQEIITPGSPGPPVVPPVYGEIHNATSLMMFGGETECILTKGRKKTEIRIRSHNGLPTPIPDPLTIPPPETAPLLSFCRISYKNMADNLQPTDPASDDNVKYALMALKHDEIIKTKGCYLPDNYTGTTASIIAARVQQIADMFKNATPTSPDPDIFNPETWFNKKGLQNDPAKKPNPGDMWSAASTVVAPCVWSTPPNGTDNCGLEGIATAIKLEQDKIDAENAKVPPLTPDPAVIAAAEIEIVHIKMRILKSNAVAAGTALGNGAATPPTGLALLLTTAWADANKAVTSVVAQYDLIPTSEKTLKDALDAHKANPTDPALKTAYEDAVKALKLVKNTYKVLSAALTPIVSKGEALRLQIDQQIHITTIAYDELVAGFHVALAKGMPKYPSKNISSQLKSDVITIKRDGTYLDRDVPSNDLTKFVSDAKIPCGRLPDKKVECNNIKPTKQRACQLLNARMGKFITIPETAIIPTPPVLIEWNPEDVWRKDVLQIIEEIFSTACLPMLKREFSIATGRIMRGYLTDMINGTIVKPPPPPSPPGPPGPPTTTTTTTTPAPMPLTPTTAAAGPSDLPPRRPFWDQIMKALEDCKKREIRLYFKSFMNGEREDYKFIKRHPNGSIEDMIIEHFIEQADDEFAFNFAIDSNWRMFATVLGICMPAYENKIPLISAKFFTHYTEDFLYPLAKEWIMIRDNAVFKYIMGEFYGGMAEQWSKLCMEASYLESGDVRYRPPRKLLVNGLTEANFFTSGPLAGTSGMYN